MTDQETAVLARIFVNEADRHEGLPVYEWIVRKGREFGLAGVTVLRGVMGFGASGQVHTYHLVEFSTNQPVVVEIVDTPEQIEAFLPLLHAAMEHGGLVTTERVEIRLRRANKRGQ